MNVQRMLNLTLVLFAAIAISGCEGAKNGAGESGGGTARSGGAAESARADDAHANSATENRRDSDMSDVARGLAGDAPAPAAGRDATAQLPPGHPPIDGSGTGMNPGNMPAARSGKTISYEVPERWKSEPPSSSMRQAQFTIPAAEGDAEEGSMVLFYFGPGEGGPVGENIDRWVAQMSDSNGQPVGDESVKHDNFEANGLKVTVVDVTGHYTNSPMMGGTGMPSQSEYRMIAAVVEGPGGPWFFKGVGPAETMAAAREETMQLLRSVRE